MFPLPEMLRRTLPLTLIAVLALALLAGPASAQSPQANAAQADGLLNKTLYRTGASGRFLMAGTWYFRADATGNGPVSDNASPSTAGWNPVSALATVYALQNTGTEASAQLAPILSSQWSVATALSLLAWYVYAPQCISTLAVIRRETLSWRAVGLSAGYLFALAYLAAFATYQVSHLLGA